MSTDTALATLRKEIERYSDLNGYKITEFASLSCDCGSNVFHLFSDDLEGAAIARCISCGDKIDILESENYSNDLLQNVCPCENEELSLGIGSALYPNSSDIRWVYVGAHCAECGLSGVYVDWQERQSNATKTALLLRFTATNGVTPGEQRETRGPLVSRDGE